MKQGLHLSLLVPMPDRAYRVDMGVGVLSKLPQMVEKLQPSSCVLCFDRNVQPYVDGVIACLEEECKLKVIRAAIESGEASKSFAGLSAIADAALGSDTPPDRQTLVLAMGGGVCGDLAGLFASIYLRGVRVLHLPTTLLAMVDSAVGGKTAINHAGIKNQLGSFHQPAGVIADVNTLVTLPEREYRAALAEVVKYGVVLDDRLLGWLEDNADALMARDPDVVTRAVAACVRDKARIVVQDEREEGLRAVLNYGHTLGHAIESASAANAGGSLLHGEAVALGMIAAASYGQHLGITDAALVERQQELLARFGLPLRLPEGLSHEALTAALAHDKKRSSQGFKLILPTSPGEWTTRLITDANELLKGLLQGLS